MTPHPRKKAMPKSTLQKRKSATDYTERLKTAVDEVKSNFNLDETGFSLAPTTGRVLAIKGQKDVYFETSGKERQILLFRQLNVQTCVSGDGSIPPPMIIYPRKRLSEEILLHAEDIDCILGKSNSGYIIREVFYEYLCNHIDKWLTDNSIQRPVVIWTDWHESRVWYHLAKKLNELKIILYGLPPITTHFLQPLDVAVFGPLKKAWKTAVRDWQEANDSTLDMTTFAHV
ncbi:uncharacterized protein [Macrobrachium rosenbergii]|uniref:uncharacterized protein n=1 Tax=Macrobrachium rosenbergii TaxID=79674 RepID=UPI0034D6F6A8